MNGQKTAAKWLAIILLVSISIFSYAMYESFFVSNGGNVQGETNTPAGGTETGNTGDDPVTPTPVPEKIYSSFPRAAQTFDNTTVQHTGGSNEEILLASHFIGDKTVAVLKTSSDSFDFKAEKHLALALFDETSLKSTLVFSEKDETYLDSKYVGSAILILSQTPSGVCKLRAFSETLAPMNETSPDFSQAVDSAYICLDDNGILIFAATSAKLFCKSLSSAFVVSDFCSPIDIVGAEIVSVQKIYENFVLGLNVSLTGVQNFIFATMNNSTGFALEKTVENVSAFAMNVAVEENVPYLVLTAKSGNGVIIKKYDILFNELYSCFLENTHSAKVAQINNGYAAVTENSIYYLCKHLDSFFRFDLAENGLCAENEFSSVGELFDFNGTLYAALYSDSTNKAVLFSIVNFTVSSLMSLGASDENVAVYVTSSTLKAVFTSALREDFYSDNFGGKDVFYVAVDTAAQQ